MNEHWNEKERQGISERVGLIEIQSIESWLV
jgi:hypothetical protein